MTYDHPDTDLTDPHGEAEALRRENARLRAELMAGRASRWAGAYRQLDAAIARAEAAEAALARLTAERDEWERQAIYHNKKHGEMLTSFRAAEAERDEARAQVAGAFDVAAQVASDFDGFGIPATFWPHEISKGIRAITPADATAALAARDAAMRNEGRRQAAELLGDSNAEYQALDRILATLEPEGGE